MTELYDKAFLINVVIHTWQARIIDDGVSEKVANEHKTDRKAGDYRKSLCLREDLKPLRMAFNRVRQTWLTYTSPWDEGSYRICSASAYMELMDKLDKDMRDAMDQKALFLDNWDAIKKRGLDRLRGDAKDGEPCLANEDDYPTREMLDQKFHIEINPSPMPRIDSDWRIKVSKSERKRIQHDMERHLSDKLQGTIDSLLTRLRDQCDHMSKALADGKTFWKTLVPNLRETVRCVRLLNMTDDSNIIKACDMIEAQLCKYDSETLREDDSLRANARKEAARIAKQMSSWM